MPMETTVGLTEQQKATVDKLQEFMNENNLGHVSKGEAIDHAAKTYLQYQVDSDE